MLSIRKIVDSYFSKRTFPYWCVLLLDSAILFPVFVNEAPGFHRAGWTRS